jgi:outer membrane receptor protein involved in Fe transport
MKKPLRGMIPALALTLVTASTLAFLSSRVALAQGAAVGVVEGVVRDRSANRPLQYANVILVNRADSTQVRGMVTDKDGRFTFSGVAAGSYVVECSFIGHKSFRSQGFVIDATHLRLDFKTIPLTDSAFAVDEVVVTSERSLFRTAIDRKVYNIDQDLMARSSTASDLLQNIPSVQVDIDGNVSLRGSTDVMILVNGKPSPLMNRSRADVLQQMPASGIEKIEVITNPSARFTPEGTSGIINIVTRKGTGSGVNGTATGHVGTTGRHNESVDFNCSPGRLNLFGSYGYRSDRRRRILTDARRQTSAAPGPWYSYREHSEITMRPHAHMANLGLEFRPDDGNTLELSGDYFLRRPDRSGGSGIITRDASGGILRDYDRLETGSEKESETGVTASFRHNFAKEDHELRLEASGSNSPETEGTHYTDVYNPPDGLQHRDNSLVTQNEKQRHLALDYVNPLDGGSRLEAGYAGDLTLLDSGSRADSLDQSSGRLVEDANRTFRYRLDQAVHAVYGTFQRSFGKVSALGGLRAEYATVRSRAVTGDSTITTDYFGLYPTLHLAYRLGDTREIQLNYSRRINRPESEDLNPFREYRDRYNLEAGNPRLKPENIHSVELGYEWREKGFSFVPSVYYRYKYDGFARVTEALGDGTYLRTFRNLANEQSAGLEPVVTASMGSALTANLNGNVFYDQIDASNIGYSTKKSIVTWSGTLIVSANLTGTTMCQLSANYRAARLTPQGEMHPSFGLNVGARQDLLREKVSLTLTVSDVLRTQKQDLNLDVAGVRQDVTNRRDSQVAYLGLAWHYGRPEKKAKEKSLQFDDQQ